MNGRGETARRERKRKEKKGGEGRGELLHTRFTTFS